MEEEIAGTREAPTVRGRGSQPELREEQAGPYGVADRLVLPLMPGNSGGGKEPDFWRVTGRDQESGDWHLRINRNYSPDVFFVPRHVRCWDDGGEGLIRRTTPPFPHCLIIFSKPVNC